MLVYFRFMDNSETRVFSYVKQLIIREKDEAIKYDFDNGDPYIYHPIDADVVYQSGNMETVVNIFDIEVE